MPITGEAFKQIGRATAGTVAVISAADRAANGIVALTVSSFITLSYSPPLSMFAVQDTSDSYASLIEGVAFGVSLLSTNQSHIAQHFARKGREKTANYPFERGSVVGVPLIPGAAAHIECRTERVFLAGDHAIVVGLIEAAQTYENQPLLHFARQYGSFSPLVTSF